MQMTPTETETETMSKQICTRHCKTLFGPEFQMGPASGLTVDQQREPYIVQHLLHLFLRRYFWSPQGVSVAGLVQILAD